MGYELLSSTTQVSHMSNLEYYIFQFQFLLKKKIKLHNFICVASKLHYCGKTSLFEYKNCNKRMVAYNININIELITSTDRYK